MATKPRPRLRAQTKAPEVKAMTKVMDAAVTDSFQNLVARLGAGSGNLQDASGYVLSNLITRQPRNLEFMYRGSWIVRAVVDSIADDMTREWVDYAAAITPEDTETLDGVITDLRLKFQVNETIKWSRLYGGAIGVMLVEGQDLVTPLKHDTVAKGQFKGILPLGRWELNPSVQELVPVLGPHLGQQKIYEVGSNAPALRGERVHHSRVIRFEGPRLPYFQRVAEQLWGLSVIEPLYDRLLAFDSASTGAAQLVYKAYLRTMKVKGLTEILGAGGKAQETLAKHMEAIRKFQSLEGMTLIDAEDEFETYTYTFAGLDALLLEFGQQLAGATGIPLVRLFGQSPAGMNSTGESDIRNYYDHIKAKQEADLRQPLSRVMDITYRSTFGRPPPPDFNFDFNPLWQMREKEKADLAEVVTRTVFQAFDGQLVGRQTALKELKQSSDMTGVWTNISDEDIEAADNEVGLPGLDGETGDLFGINPPLGVDPEASLQEIRNRAPAAGGPLTNPDPFRRLQ